MQLKWKLLYTCANCVKVPILALSRELLFHLSLSAAYVLMQEPSPEHVTPSVYSIQSTMNPRKLNWQMICIISC
jgi:hypothetical protein